MLFLPYLVKWGRVMVFTTSFIGGGNREYLEKPSPCHKSLTNFIT